MTEERVIVVIDDSQLDAALLKLDLLGTKADSVLGGGGRGGKKLDTVLPGINRELRLILGQIPGMREAMRYYFILKRLERGKAHMDIGLGNVMPAYLAIIATAIILIREIMELKQRAERREKEMEMMIRKYRGWTQEEFERNMEIWEQYPRGLPPERCI